MFFLLKLIIWVAGISVVASFALPYVGYEINRDYWKESKAVCEKNIRLCGKDLLTNGFQGERDACTPACLNPERLIRKQTGDATIDRQADTQ